MGRYNRRITADTPMTLTGPAAGTDFVKTAADPTGRTVAGTFANCAGGVTPWGTVLSGEENFHSYFGAPRARRRSTRWTPSSYKRYGVKPRSRPNAKWETFDPRFDVVARPERGEPLRLRRRGQPVGPRTSTPVKHSAMGRLKHEGANIYVTDDGTVVAYTGDDERFDYMYKFVSSKKMQPGRRRQRPWRTT